MSQLIRRGVSPRDANRKTTTLLENGYARMRRAIAVLCAALVIWSLPIAAHADDLKARFDLISFGMSRQHVSAIMPPATDVVEHTTFGLSSAVLRWQASSRGPFFAVFVAAGRVYAKRNCDRAADC